MFELFIPSLSNSFYFFFFRLLLLIYALRNLVKVVCQEVSYEIKPYDFSMKDTLCCEAVRSLRTISMCGT